MKAKDIRDIEIPDSTSLENFAVLMLQEIAAQMAEFNERCEKQCGSFDINTIYRAVEEKIRTERIK